MERLRNYRYHFVAKPAGGIRCIEAPKPLLKMVQRHVLKELIVWREHDASHGSSRRPDGPRSVRTAAACHVGQQVLVQCDLSSFYNSVSAQRVFGLFRGHGYPDHVAHVLTGLCTNVVPRSVLASLPKGSHRTERQLATPHLPQGAPTSPILASLAARSLDARLTGLANCFGATYTRYSDDLTFSGDASVSGAADRLIQVVTTIVREEGFLLNTAKTRVSQRSKQQRVLGIVVNDRVNISRREYDQLKAILHDAVRNGPFSANRHNVDQFGAQLLGRISWVASLNPERGLRLRRLFDQISWS